MARDSPGDCEVGGGLRWAAEWAGGWLVLDLTSTCTMASEANAKLHSSAKKGHNTGN